MAFRRVRRAFQVWLLKGDKGEGYQVVTHDEKNHTTLVVTPHLDYAEADDMRKAYFLIGYANKGTKRTGDMV